MRRTLAFTLTIVLLSALVLHPAALDVQDEVVIDRSALIGESEIVPMAASVKCPECSQYTLELSCGGVSIGYAAEIYCQITAHQPCIISERDQYTTMGSCTNRRCYLGNGGQYGTYQYGIHIETCKHFRTGDTVHNTCPY